MGTDLKLTKQLRIYLGQRTGWTTSPKPFHWWLVVESLEAARKHSGVTEGATGNAKNAVKRAVVGGVYEFTSPSNGETWFVGGPNAPRLVGYASDEATTTWKLDDEACSVAEAMKKGATAGANDALRATLAPIIRSIKNAKSRDERNAIRVAVLNVLFAV